MSALARLVEAGAAAWQEEEAYAAHAAWEQAWLAAAAGPRREGLRALTQWAAAAHLQTLGRHAAAERVRARALERFGRTLNRLALADFALDLPSDGGDSLWFRPQSAPLPARGVVLAAGQGRRAGGPKALVTVAGEPLWRAQVRRLQQRGIGEVTVVLHPRAGKEASTAGLRLVWGDPEATPLHSLQRALAVTPGPVIVTPVDCPVPGRAVLVRLVAAADGNRQARAARPVVVDPAGRLGGHPLWVSAELCRDLMALNADIHRLDTFLHGLGAGYVDVPVRDPGVLHNFNRDGVSQ